MRSIVNGKQFEIPDAWWDAGGMSRFTPRAKAYRAVLSQNDATIAVPMSDIAPPDRDLNVPSFCEERMIAILRAFHTDTALPPVEVKETSDAPYRYRVYDGYHRYYASAGAGFLDLPVIINRFDAEAFFAEPQD
jgi:hypothetical protein